MKETYRERPQQPICKSDEIQWAEPKQWPDEITGSILFCWPLASEAQMWEQARCCECRRRPAQWIGLGSPFGDGEQYFLESAAWCYWCYPRHHFTDEKLRLVRHAEWAREQTVDEIIELIRDARLQTDDNTVESVLPDLADQIRAAMESREKKITATGCLGSALRPRCEWIGPNVSLRDADDVNRYSSHKLVLGCPTSDG